MIIELSFLQDGMIGRRVLRWAGISLIEEGTFHGESSDIAKIFIGRLLFAGVLLVHVHERNDGLIRLQIPWELTRTRCRARVLPRPMPAASSASQIWYVPNLWWLLRCQIIAPSGGDDPDHVAEQAIGTTLRSRQIRFQVGSEMRADRCRDRGGQGHQHVSSHCRRWPRRAEPSAFACTEVDNVPFLNCPQPRHLQ